ncbi:hypothetical protein QWY93_01735 [Echinicola jeungdonensis]|uniref:Lipocalin-like domain-containing protein n=1 Tax=Echinicola jeungdonensis TaxID=709343 RepID=A0ABV5J612_9BACT|nr:hypothetical protein [Echinicola jeungdonensis]MDN3668057.1 hypothetical protein [Echinicola jeungdonensis]
MKKLLIFNLLLFFALGSCSILETKEGIEASQSYVEGEWKLVKAEGGFTVENPPEPEGPTRTEIYSFTSEGTFKKTVDGEDFHSEATGSYMIEEVSEDLKDKYLGVVVLTFTGGDGMAYNCSSSEEEKEALHISKEGQLANISWAPCDGLFLYYEKQEELGG